MRQHGSNTGGTAYCIVILCNSSIWKQYWGDSLLLLFYVIVILCNTGGTAYCIVILCNSYSMQYWGDRLLLLFYVIVWYFLSSRTYEVQPYFTNSFLISITHRIHTFFFISLETLGLNRPLKSFVCFPAYRKIVSNSSCD